MMIASNAIRETVAINAKPRRELEARSLGEIKEGRMVLGLNRINLVLGALF